MALTINIPDLSKFFSQAELLLQFLTASGVVKSQSGLEITTILSDVSAVASGAQQPTPALAGDVVKLITDLGADGVVAGSTVTELTNGATKFVQVQNAVETGQAALLGTGDLFGKHGSYLFVADGGPAGQALGL